MEQNDAYQVIVCNISWSSNTTAAYAKKNHKSDLPVQMSLDIPKQVLAQAKKNNFNDIVEQFCYNTLSRKFGREVNACQVWLPLEE